MGELFVGVRGSLLSLGFRVLGVEGIKGEPKLSYPTACALRRYWCLDTAVNSLHGSATRAANKLAEATLELGRWLKLLRRPCVCACFERISCSSPRHLWRNRVRSKQCVKRDIAHSIRSAFGNFLGRPFSLQASRATAEGQGAKSLHARR